MWEAQYNDSFGVFLNGSTSANQIVYDAMDAPITINGPFFSSGSVQLAPANGLGYNGSTAPADHQGAGRAGKHE